MRVRLHGTADDHLRRPSPGQVDIREVDDHVWVSLLDLDLGFFDRNEAPVEPVPNPFQPEKVSTMSPE